MIVGRFLVDARHRAKTIYALTDRRVLIISGLLSQTTTTLPLTSLHEISVRERSDRSGTVTFGPRHPFGNWNPGMPWPGMGQHQTPSFDMIENAKHIHDQVVEARRAVGQRAHSG